MTFDLVYALVADMCAVRLLHTHTVNQKYHTTLDGRMTGPLGLFLPYH